MTSTKFSFPFCYHWAHFVPLRGPPPCADIICECPLAIGPFKVVIQVLSYIGTSTAISFLPPSDDATNLKKKKKRLRVINPDFSNTPCSHHPGAKRFPSLVKFNMKRSRSPSSRTLRILPSPIYDRWNKRKSWADPLDKATYGIFQDTFLLVLQLVTIGGSYDLFQFVF